MYLLPSRRKKLKRQLSDNVSEAAELHPIKRARLTCANNVEVAARAHPRLAFEGRNQALSIGGRASEDLNLSLAALVKKGS